MKNLMNYFSKYCIITLLFFLFSGSGFAQIDKVFIDYERISEKVLVVWGGKMYKDQVVAIATEKGIVLIDTGKAPSLTKKYRDIIEREFGRNDFRFVINTHFHFDHTSGNQIFPEAEIISYSESPQMMEEWAKNRFEFVKTRRANQMIKWAEQLKKVEVNSNDWIRLNDYLTTGEVMLDDYENNYKLTLPNITFEEKMNLDMGNIHFELYYFGKGRHTGDDIIVYCPEEKLLFTGDLFAKGWHAISSRPNFDGHKWIIILNEIVTKEINWVYDVHNQRMTGKYFKLFAKYIIDVWTSLYEDFVAGMKFSEIETKHAYENRYNYIREFGGDINDLKQYHSANLENTWQCITGQHKSNK